MKASGLALGLLLIGGAARGEPVFTGRVSLSGLIYSETGGTSDTSMDPAGESAGRLAAAPLIAYGDLRGVLEGKRLWKDRLDLRLDLRLRLTGRYDFERKFNVDDSDVRTEVLDNPGLSLGTSARGYLGGPEYDLREIYGLMRLTGRDTLQVGRMFVREADTIKIDGVRYARKLGKSWEGSVFIGGFPNPYSRSILTDYASPCGAGVGGARTQTISESADPGSPDPEIRRGACQEDPLRLSLGAGLGARYDYSSLWGSFAVVGTFFGGPGAGGPVAPLPTPDITSLNNLQPPSDGLDAPRVYLSWINSWRPLDRLDLFSDVVFDFYGSGGPQLTRLVALGTLRLLREDRLTLRLGYSHLSSLAIDMFLNRLVQNRRSGTTLALSGFSAVENNLAVLRTGRDEVRATAEVKLVRRLGAYLDGRFRHRALMGGGLQPDVYEAAAYTDNQARFAGDATLGIRDSGSVAGLRAGLAYSLIFNYRARNHVITLDLGKDFLGDRLGLDFQYVFVHTTDTGISEPGFTCDSADPFKPGCFGWRTGTTHEVGLMLTANPTRRLFLLLDYRLIATLTSDQPRNDPPEPVPAVISNALMLRGEFRW